MWFHFPEVGAWYDPETMAAYIWNSKEPETIDFVQAINHEWLHYLIHQRVSIEATMMFDEVAKKVWEWSTEVFQILY